MKLKAFQWSACIFLLAALLTGLPAQAREEKAGCDEMQAERTTARVPIIMYHTVSKNSARHGKFAISPDELEKDLQFLQGQGYQSVFIKDLLDFVNQGRPLPDKPVLLTFDDGNYSDYLYVWPLLQKYNMRAVLSIIGKPTEEYSKESRTDIHYPHLTWEQLQEMSKSGAVEIQNHSYNMHGSIGALKRKNESQQAFEGRFMKDIERMQSLVKENLGTAPTAFTFPFGKISNGTGRCLCQMGLCASLSCREGMNVIEQGNPECLFLLKRVNRAHGRPVEEILRRIS